MKSVSYYAYNDEANNSFNYNSRKSEELPILVNCTGTISLDHPFTTYNREGRLDYYLIYMSEGRLRVWLDGEVRTVKAGDFVIFPPEYKYRYSFSGGGTLSYYFIHFTGSFAGELLSGLGAGKLPFSSHAGYSDGIAGGFSELFRAYLREGRLRDLSAGTAAQSILLSLFLANMREESEPLARSLSYIKSLYTEPIKIPELARMEGLSVSRYNTVFREVTGTSPTRYIIDLRLKQAATLLLSTDLPIGRIGSTVGYEDNHFFSKIFKCYMVWIFIF